MAFFRSLSFLLHFSIKKITVSNIFFSYWIAELLLQELNANNEEHANKDATNNFLSFIFYIFSNEKYSSLVTKKH